MVVSSPRPSPACPGAAAGVSPWQGSPLGTVRAGRCRGGGAPVPARGGGGMARGAGRSGEGVRGGTDGPSVRPVWPEGAAGRGMLRGEPQYGRRFKFQECVIVGARGAGAAPAAAPAAAPLPPWSFPAAVRRGARVRRGGPGPADRYPRRGGRRARPAPAPRSCPAAGAQRSARSEKSTGAQAERGGSASAALPTPVAGAITGGCPRGEGVCRRLGRAPPRSLETRSVREIK